MTIQLTLLPRVAFGDHGVTSPSLQQLLAALAADLLVGASTARLIDALWPDELPANPSKALQVLVSRARTQLGHQLIVNTTNGYRLALAEFEVDTGAVQLSALAAANAARNGDHRTALERAESGLALFGGWATGDPSLGSGAGEHNDPLTDLRAGRIGTRRALHRLRALSLSRTGRRDEAMAPLSEVTSTDPRDEEVLAELLRCEAVVVGPSAALERYERYRRRLREKLGSDPGRELRTVHAELLAGDAPSVRRGVLHDPNPLLGRDDDVKAVVSLVASSRVTSVIGPGGLGKTRLAHVVGRLVEQRSVHFVPLAGTADPAQVVEEVASVLGVRDTRPRAANRLTLPVDMLTGIIEACDPGPALLILDNCEHVLDGVVDLVHSLVSLSADLRVLTTSRAPLGISSESVYLLPELDLATSIDLFRARAVAARPDIELPEDAVERLCRHLDGLPLALELAAARTRVLSVPQIEQRLTDRFALLRGGPRDAPARHRTLQAVIDWSWQLLGESEQSALRRLSVFPDGFTLEAAEQTLGPDALHSLESLVDQSLVKVTQPLTAPAARYRMLETVREFATTRLTAAGGTDFAENAFRDWARTLGEQGTPELFGPDPFPSLDAVKAEQDNLVGAFHSAVRSGDARTVAAVFALVATSWMMTSQHTRVLALAPDLAFVLSHHRPAAADVEITRTALAFCVLNTVIMARPETARALLAMTKLPAVEPHDPITGIGAALASLPDMRTGDRQTLQRLYDSANPHIAGAAAMFASHVWENDGEVERARLAAVRSLELLPERPNPWLLAMARIRIGELCLQLGLREEGETYVRLTLPVLERVGATSDVAQARWALVLARLRAGDLPGAEAMVDGVAPLPSDDQHGIQALDIGVRAEIELVRGDIDLGLYRWRQTVESVRRGVKGFFASDPPGLEPWTMATEATAVIAHSRYGRLDAVSEVAERLVGKIRKLLTDSLRSQVRRPDAAGTVRSGGSPSENRLTAFLDLPVCGAALLATGLAELARLAGTVAGDATEADDVAGGGDSDDAGDTADTDNARRRAVRMIALAERFGYSVMHPTMSAELAGQQATDADRPAYESARDSYAGLDRIELQQTALDLLDGLVGHRPAATPQA